MKRNDNFLMRDIGGKPLLVPLGAHVMDMNGMVILNETGRCIWELLAKERSVDDLANAVVERFNVGIGRARADVQVFVDEINGLGLLEQ